MAFSALGEFVRFLESVGELHRVRSEVDPRLEVTEIATRALREGKPALLFERVKGSAFPLAVNVYGSERRIELALGYHPQELGERLLGFAEEAMPPRFGGLWKQRSTIGRLLSARASRSSLAMSQEVRSKMTLDELPIQTCWPGDGGRFVTLGQVITEDPVTNVRNVGIYRMHVYDGTTTGMHWQIQKGGGFHYHRASQLGRDLEVAVALGTDPALLLASVSALPEGMDEAQFAAFLRGSPTPMTKGSTISFSVPANAEFIIEGAVRREERRKEGPFGDHFGHYSHAAPFPVFHMKSITHRRQPVYPGTVVGIPPMEDKFLGDATQQILGPLARVLHKEVKDLWAYYEAGFHNLLVVSVEERYHKEAMKAALGLLGTGQLSLTKCLILVSHDVDPRNWNSVLGAIRDSFDPHFDFVMIPKVPLDTLDFTSYAMELGSKMILDATRKNRETKERRPEVDLKRVQSSDRRILEVAVVSGTMLLVKVKRDGRAVLEKLVALKGIQSMKLAAVVSEDVDIHDQENYLWGVFTRFDCERDVLFTKQSMMGISPLYQGVLGIDATWKKGYPKALVMDPSVTRMVDRRWKEYWT